MADKADSKLIKLSPDGSRTNIGGPYIIPEGVAVDAPGKRLRR